MGRANKESVSAISSRVKSETPLRDAFISCLEDYFNNVKLKEKDKPSLEQNVVITTEESKLSLKFYLFKDCFGIESIGAEPEGTGIGAECMMAVKEFVAKERLVLFAEDVHNNLFFESQGFKPSHDDPDNPGGYRSQWVWLG